MASAFSPAGVRELLGRYSLHADKALGQNFLSDGNILRQIVTAAELAPSDTVLEIGPGLGVLTRELAAKAQQVIAVELDRRLLPVLAETLAGLTNVTVVHGDGLKYDFGQLPLASVLAANLPYNIATPLVARALASGRFKRLVFLVQKEVAQRMVAIPGSEAYGALSLIVAHFAVARIVRDVPPGAFWPPPEVISSLMSLAVRPEAVPDPELFAIIHDSFRHRRKTLKKNLLLAGYRPDRVGQALSALGLDERIRAEALELMQFKELQATLR
jgi:16S rRNA (adenine1518-N6/adenine1519-N6)-dimethyltransferase